MRVYQLVWGFTALCVTVAILIATGVIHDDPNRCNPYKRGDCQVQQPLDNR